MNHDYINLQRLTNRLESNLVELQTDTSDESVWQITKTISNAKYGQVLLRKVENSSFGSQGNSTTKRGSLNDVRHRLDKVLAELERLKEIRPDPLALATYDLPTYDLPLPPRPIPQEPVTLSSVEELIPSTDDAIPIDARPPPSISSKESIASTTDISSLLSHHREVQETLTEDLASMARQLKLNTLNFSASLEKDKSMLDEADGNLQGNYDVMQKERSRLGAYSKKGGWTTCYVIMSVGAVAAAWMFMFFLIRLT